jgi:hypothetical protein
MSIPFVSSKKIHYCAAQKEKKQELVLMSALIQDESNLCFACFVLVVSSKQDILTPKCEVSQDVALI